MSCAAASEEVSLAVIVASFNARRSIAACLTSLQQQDNGHEIIVVDSSTDGTADLVVQQFPAVKVLRLSRRAFAGEARNIGIAAARAGILAFVDADCTVPEGWADAVLAAHRAPVLAVGGVVDHGGPRTAVGWAYHFCEFNLWLPGTEARKVREAPGCCLSLKRAAFERYGPFLTGTYCSDSAFQWRMTRDGEKVIFEPAIRVFHHGPERLGQLLAHIATHRRSFALVAIQEKQVTPLSRAALVLAAPALPFLLFALIARRVFTARVYRREFLAAAPLVFLGCALRAWGEAAGCLRAAIFTGRRGEHQERGGRTS